MSSECSHDTTDFSSSSLGCRCFAISQDAYLLTACASLCSTSSNCCSLTFTTHLYPQISANSPATVSSSSTSTIIFGHVFTAFRLPQDLLTASYAKNVLTATAYLCYKCGHCY